MKRSKYKKWIGNGITHIMLVAIIFMAVVVVTSKVSGGEPEMFGFQFKTVLSGSMEPEFDTGSVIVVKPVGDSERFNKGDVITFLEEDGKLITHRVVDVVSNGERVMYQTKGDNNQSPDRNLVLAENIVAQYSGFSIPFLGYIVNIAKSQNGAFLLLIPGIILLGYAGYVIFQAIREIDRSEKEKLNTIQDKSATS